MEKNPNITTPYVAPYATEHGYYLYTIKVPQRDMLMKRLAEKGIETKIYFSPVHLQPYYRTLGFKEGLLSITESVASEVLSLPIRPTLSEHDAEYIINSIKNIIER